VGTADENLGTMGDGIFDMGFYLLHSAIVDKRPVCPVAAMRSTPAKDKR
jgi:hypothetical protein